MTSTNQTNQPTISVIICTYNRSAMLKEAIDSVLAQSYPYKEIIVLDGNSPDNTPEMMQQYASNPSVIYLRDKEDKGPQYYQKEGLRLAQGKYVVFMDDDDYYTDSDFFQKAVAVHNEQHPDKLAFVSANVQKYNVVTDEMLPFSPINVHGYIDGTYYLKNFQGKCNKPISVFSTVFEREALLNADILSLNFFIDACIYMRSLLSGSAFVLSDIIGVYRIHSSNLSIRQTVDFTISGLQEKRRIYTIIKNNELFVESDEWWYNIVKNSFGYYVLFTNPNIQEFNEVKNWCMAVSKYNKKIHSLLTMLTLLLYCEKIPGVHRLLTSNKIMKIIRKQK